MPAVMPARGPQRKPMSMTGSMLAAVTDPPWGMEYTLTRLRTVARAIITADSTRIRTRRLRMGFPPVRTAGGRKPGRGRTGHGRPGRSGRQAQPAADEKTTAVALWSMGGRPLSLRRYDPDQVPRVGAWRLSALSGTPSGGAITWYNEHTTLRGRIPPGRLPRCPGRWAASTCSPTRA